MRAWMCALITASAALAHAADLDALRERAAEARHAHDLAAAEAVYNELKTRVVQDDSEEAKFALVRAALTVCEFERYAYATTKGHEARRALGDKIDAIAADAHKVLETLPEVSERYRITADLYATMIRTQYHGKQYAKDMDEAAAKALELGGENPDAYVTSSKRQLYAPEKRGGDVEAALEKLNKAIALDPQHEQALILRGIAHEKLLDLAGARADWNKVLEINPNSRAARENLDRLDRGEALDF